MLKRCLSALALSALCVGLAFAAGQEISAPGPYKQWVEEEVVYIISSRERDVYLELQTDRERQIFIEAFWKQRDPTPNTPRNEFKDEHYRRLDYANDFYGRGTPLPGWRTDRGRIYITLGPPLNVEQYDTVNGVYPTEIWFYKGDPSQGLPTAFNVIFFKKDGSGDYILYSPTEHGPRSLVAEAMGGFRDVSRISGALSDDEAAYKALMNLEPNLARQTLSLIPGEPARPGRQSLASNRLMATIFEAPRKHVDTSYADAILKYKDFVDVDYTANYIASEASLQVVRDDTGTFVVHYTIEPAKISVEEVGDKYEILFQLTGRVSDAEGRTVYQFDKDFPLSLSGREFEEMRSKSLSIQDAFPLIPGDYRFDILLKNALSKEFASSEKTLVIPKDAHSFAMSPLLLAYGVERRSSRQGERIPFQTGDALILCQSRKTFSANDDAVVFFQIYHLTDELQSSGVIRTTFFKEDKEFRTISRKAAEYDSASDFLDIHRLSEFPPGYYQVRVSLIDDEGQELLAQKENFEVSYSPAIPRPLVVSRVATAFDKTEDLYLTGLQYLNRGDSATALPRLAEAYKGNPGREDFAVVYAKALFLQADYGRVRDVLAPFADPESEPPADVVALLGQAHHALGEFGEAVLFYQAYLSRFGMNIDILNYLGTCFFQSGNRKEALDAWTKSLELNPKQERIKKLVDSLKKD